MLWAIHGVLFAQASADPAFEVDTGLTGGFDADAQFTPEGLPGSAPAERQSDEATSMFTALREQLGLRLEAGKGLVDVVVIDKVDHPTPD
jgi:uncharacterized protein (TIGR03435 family)